MIHVLKPCEWEEVQVKSFPLYGTPKIDGIRAYSKDGVLFSASNKPIPNVYLQRLRIPEGWDCELRCKGFRDTTSVVMSDRMPIDDVVVNVFDVMPTPSVVAGEVHPGRNEEGVDGQILSHIYSGNPSGYAQDEKGPFIDPYSIPEVQWRQIDAGTGYLDRLRYLEQMYPVRHGMKLRATVFRTRTVTVPVNYLRPVRVESEDALLAFAEHCLSLGEEGAMFRRGESIYKMGRSTPISSELIRYKPFADGEAVIVGFEELMHNNNEAKINEKGHTVRSSHQSSLTPGNTLGAFKVRPFCTQCNSTGLVSGSTCYACGGYTFNIGSGKGLTHALRQKYWDERDSLIGKIIKYKHLDKGEYDKPRTGIFHGFRHADDMTSY